MVVPIRDLGNKSVFFSSNTHFLQSFQLPTVFSSNHTGMDQFFAEPSPDNYDEVRGKIISPSAQVSRDSLVSSTKSSITYYERIEHITNFIQLVSLQLVDQFSQTKLYCKASNKGYLYIYRMYKSDNK